MKKMLIYAGTTEGRQLAEQLSHAGIACDVSVATEYGQSVMPQLPYVNVLVGRLDVGQMRELANQDYTAVVDATHPFAVEVTDNIRKSLEGLDIPYYRLARLMQEVHEDDCVDVFPDYASCARALEGKEGAVLLTTGSKELSAFTGSESLRERLFVRVLPGTESIVLCEKAGLSGRQIIAMHGPFSTELNLALIRQFDIRYLVTKASGSHSGWQEKLEAARTAGITACVIGAPETDGRQGDTFARVRDEVFRLCGLSAPKTAVEVSLIGIGMGRDTQTAAGIKALDDADVVFGASRMLEVAGDKEKYPYYRAEDIIPAIERLSGISETGELRVAVLFSGDTGFYSGAARLKSNLENADITDIHVFPGISSVSYLSAAVGEPWQDAFIYSLHGCKDVQKARAVVQDAVVYNEKTFLLTSDVRQVQMIGAWLSDMGVDCRIVTGFQLGCANESVESVTAERLAQMTDNGLYTLLIINEKHRRRGLGFGMSDDSFLRQDGSGEKRLVPMTKEEVRALVLSKLQLTENAVVYDIGSGTGSVAIECALSSPSVTVYAIEKKCDAQQLLRDNIERFHAVNVVPVDGEAPDALEGLEAPTHVFIGGSGGRLREIIDYVRERNENVRIVITAVSVETLSELAALTEKYDAKITQIQVSRAKKLGEYHLMKADNPVYIIEI